MRAGPVGGARRGREGKSRLLIRAQRTANRFSYERGCGIVICLVIFMVCRLIFAPMYSTSIPNFTSVGLPSGLRLRVLDMTMPRMGGAETLRELHLVDPGLAVVLSSGV